MTAEQHALAVTGTVVLCVCGVLMVIMCILCKYCLTSKKAQQWSGLSKVLIKQTLPKTHLHGKLNKIVSDESQLMLKMHQGHYVGYEALEQDINLPKLSTSHRESTLKPYILSTKPPDSSEHAETEKADTTVDMTGLKSMPSPVDRSRLHSSFSDPTRLPSDDAELSFSTEPRVIIRTPSNKQRARHHSFHNSYTIYEESDLSEAESGVVDGPSESEEEDEVCHTELLHRKTSSTSSVNGSSSRNSSVGSSISCESFSSTLDLLGQHSEPSDLGQVEYTLAYHRDNEQLVLHIIQARQLELITPATGDRLDCFIKSFATQSDGAEPKKQTKICKGTANPIFKENFLFRIPRQQLAIQTVTMQIFSRDHYARQKLIGEITVDLSPLLISNAYRTWENIMDYDHRPRPSCADMNVGLKYSTEGEQMEVIVRELNSLRLESSPVYQYKDLFIVATLLSEADKPVDKIRTPTQSVITSSHSTVFERASVVFKNVSSKSLQGYKLVLELRQQFPDRSHDTLGYTILGSGSTGQEYGHWLLACQGHIQDPIYMYHKAVTTPQRLKYKPRFKLRL